MPYEPIPSYPDTNLPLTGTEHLIVSQRGKAGKVTVAQVVSLAAPSGAGVATALANPVNTPGGLLTRPLTADEISEASVVDGVNQAITFGTAPSTYSLGDTFTITGVDASTGNFQRLVGFNRLWAPTSDSSASKFTFEVSGFSTGLFSTGNWSMYRATGTNRSAKNVNRITGYETHIGNQSNSVGGYVQTATGSWSSGSTSLNLSSAASTAITAGMAVRAANGSIPDGTRVASVSGTSVTLDTQTTALGSSVALSFYAVVSDISHILLGSVDVDLLNPTNVNTGLYISPMKVAGVITGIGINQTGVSDINLFAGTMTIGNGGLTGAVAQIVSSVATWKFRQQNGGNYLDLALPGNVHWYSGNSNDFTSPDGKYHMSCFDGSTYRDTWTLSTTGDTAQLGNMAIGTAGKGLQIKEGSNAKQGVVTLVAGTLTVANTSVTSTSRIFLTVQSLGTVSVPTPIAVTSRSAGTSFTITSASITDTSVVAYEIFEAA